MGHLAAPDVPRDAVPRAPARDHVRAVGPPLALLRFERIRMRVFHLVSLLFVGLVLPTACTSTTSIEQSWRSPSAPSGDLTNVVTMAESKSPSIRRGSEDKLAMQLQQRGIHAVPAYSVVPDAMLGNRDEMMSYLRQKGFDGVVSMRFLGAHEKLVSYPSLYDYWGPGWGYGYYYGGYDVYPETIVRVSISAYSLPTNNLVWSAVSRSVDPDNLNELINDTTKVAARELQKQEVIPTPVQTAQR
jgi:hypothetical protein